MLEYLIHNHSTVRCWKLLKAHLDFGKWAQASDRIQMSSFVKNLATVGTLSKGMKFSSSRKFS